MKPNRPVLMPSKGKPSRAAALLWCKIVPSPPIVMIKSQFFSLTPSENSASIPKERSFSSTAETLPSSGFFIFLQMIIFINFLV
jgi:hypothetical protein